MNFISAQSDSEYNIWQLKVQMFNFKKFGIEDKAIILIGYNPTIGISDAAFEFKKSTTATVIFLQDKRDLSDRLYTPSIRPHLIKQLYIHYPNLVENRVILYHDCDILFIKLPDLKDLIKSPKIFVSSTELNVVENIDENLLKEMCKSVGISKSMVLRNMKGTGGSQYLFNSVFNFSYDFWDKIETDSNNIYKLLLVNSEKTIDAWTADLWAILWNIWLVGIDTEVTNELSFSSPELPIDVLENRNIYHNAGVKEEMKNILFYKRDFMDLSPFNHDLSYVSDEYCSVFYAREIMEASKFYKFK